MQRLGRFVKATGFRRGVLGGSRNWFALWVALSAAGWLRRKAGRTEKIAYRSELHPGEQLVITHEDVVRRRRA